MREFQTVLGAIVALQALGWEPPSDRAMAQAPDQSTIAQMARQTGDQSRGQQLFDDRCSGCHSLDANRIGPALRGVSGRRAGTAPDFRYTPALASSRIVWDQASLDQWLSAPTALIPGTAMSLRVTKNQDRADLIAFLEASGAPTRRARLQASDPVARTPAR